MRAFVAVEIPEALKEGLAAVQDRLMRAGADGSWPRPQAVHLTLKFLGEVSEDRAPEILQALSRALPGAARFRIGVEGVGAFPSPERARVAWAGINGDLDQLAAVQAAVERGLVDVGVEREDRPFTPHVTLGRIRRIRAPKEWRRALEELKGFSLPVFDVLAIILMRSELKPSGAEHREIGRVELK